MTRLAGRRRIAGSCIWCSASATTWQHWSAMWAAESADGIRMSTPFNSRLRITSQPRLAKLASSISGAGIGFRLDRHLEAVGTVAFNHARGSTAGWQIGFIQAQWIETNWAVYRGMTQAAGSVFVQRGPTARTTAASVPRFGVGEHPFLRASGGWHSHSDRRHRKHPVRGEFAAQSQLSIGGGGVAQRPAARSIPIYSHQYANRPN